MNNLRVTSIKNKKAFEIADVVMLGFLVLASVTFMIMLFFSAMGGSKASEGSTQGYIMAEVAIQDSNYLNGLMQMKLSSGQEVGSFIESSVLDPTASETVNGYNELCGIFDSKYSSSYYFQVKEGDTLIHECGYAPTSKFYKSTIKLPSPNKKIVEVTLETW